MEVEIEISKEELIKLITDRIGPKVDGEIIEVDEHIHWGDQEFIGFTVKVKI